MRKTVSLYTALFVTATCSFTAITCAYLTLRRLGDILSSSGSLLGTETADMLGGIFSQLEHAQIAPGWLIPALLFAVLGVLSFLRSRKFLWGLPLVWLISYVFSLLTAVINGARFGDIVFSLVKMAQNGLFDVL